MKYKFHEEPPDFPAMNNSSDYIGEVDSREFKTEICFISKYLSISTNRIWIDGDHPVGEDVIFIDGHYSGYLDFEFYTFMDSGFDMYGLFADWKEYYKEKT